MNTMKMMYVSSTVMSAEFAMSEFGVFAANALCCCTACCQMTGGTAFLRLF